MFGVQLGGALKQSAVQIEHIARIRFAPRRAAQQQRHLAVCPCVLGKVVVDDERVPALPHELFRHRAAGVWRKILHRRRIGCVGGDHNRVFHSAVFFKQRNRLRHLADLLPYGDIDADKIAALLIDDAVNGNRGLAG